MFTIVGEAPFVNRVAVECPTCKVKAKEGTATPSFYKDPNDSATLFFSEETKTFITCCAACGVTNKDEQSIMESRTKCCSCDNDITIKDIRESVPCSSCEDVNNRVVATTKYYSKIEPLKLNQI